MILTGSIVLAASAPAQTGQVLDAPFLDQLRREIRASHPTARAAQARARAAAAEIRAVRLWEDPTVGLGIMAAEVERRRAEGDLVFSLEVPLPRPGLRDARRQAAMAGRDQSEAEQRASVLTLETLAVHSAIALALADETLVIQSNQVTWLEGITANARERLKDPKTSAAEPLRLEGELAQERQRLDTALRQRLSRERQLNTLLGRSLTASWPILTLPPSAGESAMVLTNALKQLAQANPTLQRLAGAVGAAQATVEITRQEQKPLFSVGTDTTVYSGGRFTETMIAAKMSVPWVNRSANRARIDRAREDQAAAELDLAAQERLLGGDLISAQTEAENAARQAGTMALEVIPRMTAAMQALEGAWVSSRASLLEVLEARRSLLNARLEQRRAVAAHEAAQATLRSLVPPGTDP